MEMKTIGKTRKELVTTATDREQCKSLISALCATEARRRSCDVKWRFRKCSQSAERKQTRSKYD